MAKGLDCGTSFYITATEDKIKKQRNAFLTVDGETSQVKRMLKRQGIPYVEKNKKIVAQLSNFCPLCCLVILKVASCDLQLVVFLAGKWAAVLV